MLEATWVAEPERCTKICHLWNERTAISSSKLREWIAATRAGQQVVLSTENFKHHLTKIRTSNAQQLKKQWIVCVCWTCLLTVRWHSDDQEKGKDSVFHRGACILTAYNCIGITRHMYGNTHDCEKEVFPYVSHHIIISIFRGIHILICDGDIMWSTRMWFAVAVCATFLDSKLLQRFWKYRMESSKVWWWICTWYGSLQNGGFPHMIHLNGIFH